ncbi:MAG: alkaline phosphatase family protein [Calditrichota bacterium]
MTIPGKRIAVLGLDCAAPRLLFQDYRDDLPTFHRLMEAGSWGILQSVLPPITAPAWNCLFSGKDPGQLGCSGFRNRRDYSYHSLAIATGSTIHAPMIWDVLGKYGFQSIVIGVPQTYPPKPISGMLISGLLTPKGGPRATYPETLWHEIEQVAPGYQFDVVDFRQKDPDTLIREVYTMTANRFKVAKYLATRKPWNLFTMVEIGLDRIHHVFWKYMDPEHPLFEPNSRYRNVIREYYRFLDAQTGELLEAFPAQTEIMVVSDHGAQAMQGGFCLNEWLIREGYLVLRNAPAGITPLTPDMIDWEQTQAWGTGGYYGRIFLNVQGREPRGVLSGEQLQEVRATLRQKLRDVSEGSHQISNQVWTPEELYREITGIPPDLLIFPQEMQWRSLGSVGYGSIFSLENDEGPDGANHARNGVIIQSGPNQKLQDTGELNLLDLFPLLLEKFGIPVRG